MLSYYESPKRSIYTNHLNSCIGEIPMVTAYCVKCKKKVTMKDPKAITMKNGRPAKKGTCPKCKTKVFRIGK